MSKSTSPAVTHGLDISRPHTTRSGSGARVSKEKNTVQKFCKLSIPSGFIHVVFGMTVAEVEANSTTHT